MLKKKVQRKPRMPKAKKKVCFFCVEKIDKIDYKDSEILRKFMTAQSKIASPKRTGLCAKHQRMLSSAVKRARFMAVVPYTSR